jgi:TPR repeat protein
VIVEHALDGTYISNRLCQAETMRWLDRLRERGRPQAVEESTSDRMRRAYDAAACGEYASALAVWGPLAQAGVPRAQNSVGACFAEGLGVERDPALARQWLTLAADAGDAVGQRNLATLYYNGVGVGPDYVRAAALYRAAAEQGDGPAQDMLSSMLLDGEVAEPDPVEAQRWALAAAEQGMVSSMTRLGKMFHDALGVDRDPAEAARWWRRAAERGDADGQTLLGAALHLGAGVTRDERAALAWLVRARAGGSKMADLFIGPVRAALAPAEIAEAERQAAEPLAEPQLRSISSAAKVPMLLPSRRTVTRSTSPAISSSR